MKIGPGCGLSPYGNLSRRERQVMEVLLRRGSASVAEVLEEIPDPPGYSGLRCTVNVLERKGYIRHARKGKRYIYTPTTPRTKALRGALRQLLGTYFGDSPVDAVAAIVALHGKDLGPGDIKRLEKLIRGRGGGDTPK
jgi:predicted transcriptional regulator